VGARISEGLISALIFFLDPLGTRPHDADVNVLIRIATLYEVPFATNQAGADLVIEGLTARKLVGSAGYPAPAYAEDFAAIPGPGRPSL